MIERIFGVLKWQFTILDRPPEYSMAVQAHILPALAAVHNFICIHDEEEILDFQDLEDGEPGECDYGKLAEGPPNRTEKSRSEVKWDGITQAMWDSYQTLINEGYTGQE